VRIFRAKAITKPSDELHATSADFCRIFEDEMDPLYLLSLLLTANRELAEKCFVRGLEDSKGGSPVFKEWARAWARRTIIVNAIRMIGPRPQKRGADTAPAPAPKDLELPQELAAVAGLPAFERFVFVMSTLEGYSERDCRLLLDCSNSDIVRARMSALTQIGHSAEDQEKIANKTESQPESAESVVSHSFLSHLAVSA